MIIVVVVACSPRTSVFVPAMTEVDVFSTIVVMMSVLNVRLVVRL